ncbi:hypothetical protein DdX_21048 [Ditylenchus destructor]|uniref:Uncharacterized protein n=1 Tax=Ditylenchus destructor TaxID=166010 RepID=A0AAD4QVL5_9BILA|nr:hypothetical protein DdX_21048 [Ditylenchus destructor]
MVMAPARSVAVRWTPIGEILSLAAQAGATGTRAGTHAARTNEISDDLVIVTTPQRGRRLGTRPGATDEGGMGCRTTNAGGIPAFFRIERHDNNPAIHTSPMSRLPVAATGGELPNMASHVLYATDRVPGPRRQWTGRRAEVDLRVDYRSACIAKKPREANAVVTHETPTSWQTGEKAATPGPRSHCLDGLQTNRRLRDHALRMATFPPECGSGKQCP